MPHALRYNGKEVIDICSLPKENRAKTEQPRAELVYVSRCVTPSVSVPPDVKGRECVAEESSRSVSVQELLQRRYGLDLGYFIIAANVQDVSWAGDMWLGNKEVLGKASGYG